MFLLSLCQLGREAESGRGLHSCPHKLVSTGCDWCVSSLFRPLSEAKCVSCFLRLCLSLADWAGPSLFWDTGHLRIYSGSGELRDEQIEETRHQGWGYIRDTLLMLLQWEVWDWVSPTNGWGIKAVIGLLNLFIDYLLWTHLCTEG